MPRARSFATFAAVADDASPRALAWTVVALGIAQIISWGTLFYTVAVLGPALAEVAGVGERHGLAVIRFAVVLEPVLVAFAAALVARRLEVRGGGFLDVVRAVAIGADRHPGEVSAACHGC